MAEKRGGLTQCLPNLPDQCYRAESSEGCSGHGYSQPNFTAIKICPPGVHVCTTPLPNYGKV